MRVARSSFDGDLPPEKLPLRDDEPPPDDEPRRKHDPLLLMARLIGGGVGLNCSLQFSRFVAAERATEWLGDGGSRVSTRKHLSSRYLYGPPLHENGPT
jgi:hypothetical protein